MRCETQASTIGRSAPWGSLSVERKEVEYTKYPQGQRVEEVDEAALCSMRIAGVCTKGFYLGPHDALGTTNPREISPDGLNIFYDPCCHSRRYIYASLR